MGWKGGLGCDKKEGLGWEGGRLGWDGREGSGSVELPGIRQQDKKPVFSDFSRRLPGTSPLG